MTEPTPEELKAENAELKRQLALAQSQQSAQVSGSGFHSSGAWHRGRRAGRGCRPGRQGCRDCPRRCDGSLRRSAGGDDRGRSPIGAGPLLAARHQPQPLSCSSRASARAAGWSTSSSIRSTSRLRATQQRAVDEDERVAARGSCPGAGRTAARGEKDARRLATETVTVSVKEALARTRAWWCWAIRAAARPRCCAIWRCSMRVTWREGSDAGARAGWA